MAPTPRPPKCQESCNKDGSQRHLGKCSTGATARSVWLHPRTGLSEPGVPGGAVGGTLLLVGTTSQERWRPPGSQYSGRRKVAGLGFSVIFWGRFQMHGNREIRLAYGEWYWGGGFLVARASGGGTQRPPIEHDLEAKMTAQGAQTGRGDHGLASSSL